MAKKRTYADRAPYLIQAVAKRRRKVKEMGIAYLGGQCQICGYQRCQEALDFHHRDSSQKDFGIAAKVIRVHGKKFEPSSTSASWFARIVTEKYTPALRSFLLKSRLKHRVNCREAPIGLSPMR